MRRVDTADIPVWSLLSVALAALAGAGLNHAFGRRAESMRALREARAKWAVEAMAFRDANLEDVVMGTYARPKAPDIEPALRVIDPRGARYAHTLVMVQSSAERHIADQWVGGNGVYSTITPPQLRGLGLLMERTIALWAQASWRMPVWRLRLITWWVVRRERLWTEFMHGELHAEQQRATDRADAASFRKYARARRREVRRSRRGQKPAGPFIDCSTCKRPASMEMGELLTLDDGTEIVRETYRCRKRHETVSEQPHQMDAIG